MSMRVARARTPHLLPIFASHFFLWVKCISLSDFQISPSRPFIAIPTYLVPFPMGIMTIHAMMHLCFNIKYSRCKCKLSSNGCQNMCQMLAWLNKPLIFSLSHTFFFISQHVITSVITKQ